LLLCFPRTRLRHCCSSLCRRERCTPLPPARYPHALHR